MMNWQKLLICNIPRDGGNNDSSSNGDNQGSAVGDPSDDTSDTVGPNDPANAPSPNAVEAAFQGGIPGLSFGSSLSSALGPTSMGSFGLSGVTSNTSAPGTSTPFGGAVTDPGSVPGYEGPGNTVADTSFGGSLAPDLGNLGEDLTSGANSVFADPGVSTVSYDKVGALTNVTAALSPTTTPVSQTTTPVSPTTTTTTIGTTTGKSTAVSPSTSTPSTSTPSTSTSTSTISSMIDGFLSGLDTTRGSPAGDASGGNNVGGTGGGITTIPSTTTTKTTPADTFVTYDLGKKDTPAPVYTYPNYGVYTAPKITAPQGASFSDNYALQFPVIPKYPNLSNTNQGILDAFPV